MAHEYIEMMKREGWQVYVRPTPNPEYCYCTDGKNICYVQWSRGESSVSTVHVPNRQAGTGYGYANEITPESVRGAMMCFAPSWALRRDIARIRKWNDWNHLHQSSSWTKEMVQA